MKNDPKRANIILFGNMNDYAFRVEMEDYITENMLPSIQIVNLVPFGEQDCILIVGRSNFQLYTVSGSLIGGGQFPLPPTGLPVVGDFNNDGYNDIIIETNNGFYGFAQVRGTGSVLFRVLIAVLLIILIALSIIQSFPEQYAQVKGNLVARFKRED